MTRSRLKYPERACGPSTSRLRPRSRTRPPDRAGEPAGSSIRRIARPPPVVRRRCACRAVRIRSRCNSRARARMRSKACLAGVDAPRDHEADAAFELIDRGADVELCVIGQRAQLRDSLVRVAGDRENRLIRSSASRGSAPPFNVDCSRKRSADFRDGAPADVGWCRRSTSDGHQRQRRLAVGASECGEHTLIFIAARSVCERQALEILPRLILRLKSLISRRRHTG